MTLWGGLFGILGLIAALVFCRRKDLTCDLSKICSCQCLKISSRESSRSSSAASNSKTKGTKKESEKKRMNKIRSNKVDVAPYPATTKIQDNNFNTTRQQEDNNHLEMNDISSIIRNNKNRERIQQQLSYDDHPFAITESRTDDIYSDDIIRETVTSL